MPSFSSCFSFCNSWGICALSTSGTSPRRGRVSQLSGATSGGDSSQIPNPVSCTSVHDTTKPHSIPHISRPQFPISRCYATLSLSEADKLSEHVIGVAKAPVGWMSLVLNSQTIVLPFMNGAGSEMSREKQEALAMLSQSELFRSDSRPIVQAQIHLISNAAKFPIEEIQVLLDHHRDSWQSVAEESIPGMVKRGGGPCGFHLAEVHGLSPESVSSMAILTLDVNVCDAMGANCLNMVAEAVSEKITEVLPENVRVGMRILTNACPFRRISLTWDLPDSPKMADLKSAWDSVRDDMSGSECIYPFARGMTDVAKVTANDSRAVLAALTYDLHVNGKLPFDIVLTDRGFQIRIDAPASFGSVGRLSRFPCAVESLERMGIKHASDIAFHAAVLGTIETLSWLDGFSVGDKTASKGSLGFAYFDRTLNPVLQPPLHPVLPKLREMDIDGRREVLATVLGKGFSAVQQLDPERSVSVPIVAFPAGVMPNLVMNGRLVHVLAVTEEPSVVAGACFGIKLLSHGLMASVETQERFLKVTLHAKIPVSALSRGGAYPGDKVRDAVVADCHLANACPERATTNNKGFDNGMNAAALALGWDEILLSLAMHESAIGGQMEAPFETTSILGSAKPSKKYGAIVQWRVASDGDLEGHCQLSVPLAVLYKSGGFSSAAMAENLLSASVEDQLAAVIAVGMGVHLASLIALGTKGIQANHMVFHAR